MSPGPAAILRPATVTRSQRAFIDELPGLLAERGISIRRLAGLAPSHISRVLRGAAGKRPSLELIERVTKVLDLDEGYFPEVRRWRVYEAVTDDPDLRDRLYEDLRSEGRL